MAAIRVLVVWCPDWPVVALGQITGPTAILTAGRVVACSAAARADGVRRGLRRRETQRRCPQIRLLDRDEGAEARAFEPILTALQDVSPRLDVIRPGLCALPTKGAARYFGSEEALVTVAAGAVADLLGADFAEASYRCHVGIADGLFAATRAARRDQIVPPGGSSSFLASYPVGTLDRPELADLLIRLGIRTLGDLAALPAAAVMTRFGWEGARAHRLASGRDERPLVTRTASADLTADITLDPPAEQVEPMIFVGRTLAERLHESLAAQGLSCSRVLIEAETEHGQLLSRYWRHDADFTPALLAQRLRWQLDGWLSGAPTERPTGGVVRLRLVADEVHRQPGQQLGLWGDPADEVIDGKVARALARLQGLFGLEAVMVASPTGGRGPAERTQLTPWGEPPLPPEPDFPWPGQLPSPAPATVYSALPTIQVLTREGKSVSVDNRGLVSGLPARLALNRTETVGITAWAGPWPIQERWWDAGGRSFARFQVLTSDGIARLIGIDEHGQGWLEAVYD